MGSSSGKETLLLTGSRKEKNYNNELIKTMEAR